MSVNLFESLKLPNITLPGRVVRSATELFCSTPDAHIRPFEVEVYRELAGEGLGMILTAHTCVSPEGRSNVWQNGLWSDDYIDETRELVLAAGNTPVVAQLGHGGMKAEGNNGGLTVFTPDSMTVEEIHSVVRAFGAAAKRAMTAGCAGIMLHGAHLYLLSQMFYPEFNHRTDAYGGSAENRFRIFREIFEEIKTVCGEKTPVFLKINGDDRNDTEEYRRDLVTALDICERLMFDAVEISGWASARNGVPDKPYFLDTLFQMSREVEVNLIGVGGIRSMEDIEQMFKHGASAVSMSRPFLQNPQVLRDFAEGKPSGCTGCCTCFQPLNLDKNPPVRCPFRKK